MRLPDSLVDLFQNYIFDTIDDDKHSRLIVKTVLAYGTWEQILWLFRHYGRERIRDIFLEDYYGLCTLPEPTRKLWELLFVEKPLEQPKQEDDRGARWRCRRGVGHSHESKMRVTGDEPLQVVDFIVQ